MQISEGTTMPPGRTFAEIMALHDEFWRESAKRLDRQFKDEELSREALADLHEQQVLGIPIRYQRSLESLFNKAEDRREAHRISQLRGVRQENGRLGGQLRRPDTLQNLIEEIVVSRPNISCVDLIELLRHKIHAGIIEDVTEEDISFIDSYGRSRSVKITALKDRLSRAKKKMQSQKAVSANTP